MSEAEALAVAFSRRRESKINRPRDDVGAEATLVGANECSPHRDRRSGGRPTVRFNGLLSRLAPTIPLILLTECGDRVSFNRREKVRRVGSRFCLARPFVDTCRISR
jgi:hypothetical protein